MILRNEEVDEPDIHGKRMMLRHQLAQLHAAGVQAVEIDCPCGRRMLVRKAYKCFFCGLWLCSRCAERHFVERHTSHVPPHGDDQAAGLRRAMATGEVPS